MNPPAYREIPSAPPSYMTFTDNTHLYAQQQRIPPPPAQPQVIVIQNDILLLGHESVQLICPTCKVQVTSIVERESSISAYICCMFLFRIGCVLCSCLPFFMDKFKLYKHSCPNCRALIGTWSGVGTKFRPGD